MALGRIPTGPVVLPDVSFEAGVLADWIKETEAPQRRPDATAKVLALAVLLHLDGMRSWPTRAQVCAHLKVSLPMIDVVLSQRQASGHLTVWTTTVEGNVARRPSVITLRHIQPSQELLDIIKKARFEQRRTREGEALDVALERRRRRRGGTRRGKTG